MRPFSPKNASFASSADPTTPITSKEVLHKIPASPSRVSRLSEITTVGTRHCIIRTHRQRVSPNRRRVLHATLVLNAVHELSSHLWNVFGKNVSMTALISQRLYLLRLPYYLLRLPYFSQRLYLLRLPY